MKEIDLSEFDKMKDKAVVVDVLPRPSYRSGHIPGSINLPVDELDDKVTDLLPELHADIVVYCGGPKCPLARIAQQRLIELGYANVSHYLGGLKEWTGEGRSLDRESGAVSVISDAPANRIMRFINSMSLAQWLGIWMVMVVGCGAMFWVMGQTEWAGLNHNGEPLPKGIGSFGDCLYFSVVTATTLGYGDITPVTAWARLLASCEAIAGMVLVGALISKLLSTHQTQLLAETHQLAFKERLGRIQTSLHLLIKEFQDIEAAHVSDTTNERSADLRLSSGSAILIRNLRIVRDLLHDRRQRADEPSIELLLVTLDGAMESYLNVLSQCSLNQKRSAHQLGELVEEICAECVPHQYSENVQVLINRTHILSQRILGIASARRH